MVECESQIVPSYNGKAYSFNRYMVECESPKKNTITTDQSGF